MAQTVKLLPAIQDTRIRALGQEHLLEKETATQSSILAWKIPWTEELVGYSPQVAKSQTQLIDFNSTLVNIRASLVGQPVKNPPAMREIWVRPLGWEDPLEKRKATHSSILSWRIPQTI